MRARITRILRGGLVVLGTVLLVLAIFVGVFLVGSTPREALLGRAVEMAKKKLPGQISIGKLGWPSLGQLVLTDVLWTVEADTLVVAKGARVRIDTLALARKDVLLHELTLEGLRADVPRIAAQFPANPDKAKAPAKAPSFPRPGSLIVLPSIRVAHLNIDAPALRLVPERPTTRVTLVAAFDVAYGHAPSLSIEQLSVDDEVATLNTAAEPLQADLRARSGGGHLEGKLFNGWGFELDLHADDKNQFTVRVVVPEDNVPRLRLDLTGRLTYEDSKLSGGEYLLNVDMRSPTMLAEFPSLAAAAAQLPDEPLVFAVSGTFGTTTSVQTTATLKLEPIGPIQGLTSNFTVSRGSTLAVESTLMAQLRDLPIDSLVVTVSGDPQQAIDLSVQARASGIWASVRGNLQRSETELGLRLAPIRIDADQPGHALDLADQPSAVLNTATGEVDVRRLDLQGLTGPVTIKGTWHPERGGRANVTARMRTMPPLLETFGLAELGRSWETQTQLNIDATVDPDQRWEARARFLLPGPSNLRSFLPPEAPVDDLGPFRGNLVAHGTGPNAKFDLDLSATEWIERAVAEGRFVDATVSLDSLQIELPGLMSTATGTLDANRQIALRANVQLDDTRFVARFVPAAADLTAAANLDIEASGTMDAIDATVKLAARVGSAPTDGSPGVFVPELTARATIVAGSLERVTARTTEVWASDLNLNSVVLEAAPHSGERPFPMTVVVDAQGDEVSLFHAGAIDLADGFEISPDTVAVRLGDATLGSLRPFTIHIQPEQRINFSPIELKGSLGEIRAWGSSERFDVDVTINQIPRVSFLPVPAEFNFDRAHAHLAAHPDSMQLDGEITGLHLGDIPDAKVVLHASPGDQGLDVTIEASGTSPGSDRTTDPLSLHATLPIRIASSPLTLTRTSGSARLDATLHDFPVPASIEPQAMQAFLAGQAERVARLNGSARLNLESTASTDSTETRNNIDGRLDGTITFPGWPRLEPYRIDLSANLPAGTEPQVDVGLHWRTTSNKGRGKAAIPIEPLTATARVPLTLKGPQPIQVDHSRPFAASVVAKEWALGSLAAWMPPGSELTGRVNADIQVEGPFDDTGLGGWLSVTDGHIRTDDGSRGNIAGRIDLAGTTTAPNVTGNLTISQARIQIPSPAPTLLPTQGPSMLWQLRPVEAGADSATVASTTNATAIEMLDLGIDVRIPGAFWLRGRGLNVELAGDLALVFRRARPSLLGTLRAVRGDLSFVGSRFQIERGRVDFFGDDKIDPELDLKLSRQQGNVTVSVQVSGRASDPKLELSSVPQMEQGDIISYLLFGRRSDDLDREQSDLVEAQALGALQMFAIPGLEDQFSQQLGLDLVQLKNGTENAGLSVVVGKYLSPRALLKYEQDLTDNQFVINLEYWLTRSLKLETRTNRQANSGIEINWSREY